MVGFDFAGRFMALGKQRRGGDGQWRHPIAIQPESNRYYALYDGLGRER
jgi:hypothetical protein